MPVRKSTQTKTQKSSKGEEEADSVSQTEDEVSTSSPQDLTKAVQGEEVSDRQLFFSTDGNEPEEERPHPDERKELFENDSSDQDKPKPTDGEANQSKVVTAGQDAPNDSAGNSPKGDSPQGSSPKKLTWQEKKKLRRKQKFKKPRRLPYEETETKALEVGQLLDSELLKTEQGIDDLVQPFVDGGTDILNLDEFLSLNLLDLTQKVGPFDSEGKLPNAPMREELIDLVLDSALKSETPVTLSGIIQVMEDGHGFILQQKEDYRLKSQSAFVPERLVRRYGLKTGHLIKGLIRAKMEDSSCPVLLRVDEVMGMSPDEATRVTPFTELTPYYPLRRMYLETHQEVEWDNVAMRVVDLVSPVGFGQRGLIVAPPRTGKTVLQQGVARALRKNNPDAHLIVLLVNELPV